MTGYNTNTDRKITDDEIGWLEQAREPDPGPRTRCCARCKRGTVPGQFPCGRALNCGCHERPVDEKERR